MSRTVAITGIHGDQQAAAAHAFREAGWQVRGVVRQAPDVNSGGVRIGDLASGEGLEQAFEGADVVAFTLPQDHSEGTMAQMARNVAKATQRANVKRVILNLAGTVAENSSAPMFAAMRAARDAIRETGAASTVLQPTVYMDNLLAPWILPRIVNDGVLAYPAPEDAPISWISHRTLGAFFVAVAENDKAAGRVYKVGGPEALTGPELAAILQKRLGRAVAYQRLPLNTFAAGLNQAFGPPAGDRIASLYAHIEDDPTAMNVRHQAAEEVGVEPESFAEFAARQKWAFP